MIVKKSVRAHVPSLVLFALLFSVVCATAIEENGAKSERLANALQSAAQFAEIDSRRDDEEKIDGILSSLRLGDEGFDKTNGEWVLVYSPELMMKVVISDGKVAWALFVTETPEEYALLDENRHPIPQNELRKMAVSVSLSEAEHEASRFVRDHVGQNALDGLSLVRNELVSRGSHFAYYFVWREKQTEEGTAVGMRLFSVTVNPRSGKVAEFLRSDSSVDREVSIDAEQCRQRVSTKFGHLEGFRIERVSLVTLKHPDREDQPVWAVSYSYESLTGRRSNACYVDATTGELLDE